ncbi:MAG: hypothetical protein QG599_3301 [Pseudomonadota bacterium]|nr:hypothetical protein [Pseudomonadota bacterium]
MTGLCLGLAGVAWAMLPIAEFTLAWTHTVEKIRWEEDYRVTADGLLLTEARIRGSGAGMEIPEDAIWAKGVWRYRPALPPQQPLRLARIPEAGDYQLCRAADCQEFSMWLGPSHADRPWLEVWGCPIAESPVRH